MALRITSNFRIQAPKLQGGIFYPGWDGLPIPEDTRLGETKCNPTPKIDMKRWVARCSTQPTPEPDSLNAVPAQIQQYLLALFRRSLAKRFV